jgi:hypothetical protein
MSFMGTIGDVRVPVEAWCAKSTGACRSWCVPGYDGRAGGVSTHGND